MSAPAVLTPPPTQSQRGRCASSEGWGVPLGGAVEMTSFRVTAASSMPTAIAHRSGVPRSAAVPNDGHLLHGHECALEHVFDRRQESRDFIVGIDDLDEDRKILRQL